MMLRTVLYRKRELVPHRAGREGQVGCLRVSWLSWGQMDRSISVATAKSLNFNLLLTIHFPSMPENSSDLNSLVPLSHVGDLLYSIRLKLANMCMKRVGTRPIRHPVPTRVDKSGIRWFSWGLTDN